MPIVDSFVVKQNIPLVYIDEVIYWDPITGEDLIRAPPKFCLPHLHFLRRPYAELFQRGGIVSEGEDCIAGITSEFFMDGFLFTKENNSQIVQPLGCYWSSPNLVGDRNWVWQFAMAPKNVHRYSFAGKLESECLDLTFAGVTCKIWHPKEERFYKGDMHLLPIKWELDLKETHPCTGKIAGGGYCDSRFLCIHFTDELDYNSHGGWDKNIWLSGKVPRGNVELYTPFTVWVGPFD